MTKNFDTLLESVLQKLDEAPISHENPEEIVTKAVQTAKASGKGHWTPVAKMGDEKAMADFIRKVVNRVLPEKNNTYNPDINTKDELKNETLKAIEAEMKKSGWAQKFLADRLSNKELLGSVTFEVAANALRSEEPVTQKEISAALKKKVEEISTPEGQKARIEKNAEKAPRTASEGYNKNRSYNLNDIAAGTLKGEYVDYYNALEHAGAKEELDGRALEDALKNAGATVSRIPGILSNFVSKGILTKAEEANTKEKDYEEGNTGEEPTLPEEDDVEELGGGFSDSFNRTFSPFASETAE
jgi:ribosome-binding protein aMBF1 (putative translation factor)